ncbi:hypothetical protein, conserved [Eimeria brunetti]|uniref:alpha,alpha-trehalase n=1 Tax=Eimeria brunetti TaxID=51314 RepID=U6L608_9EIME|nr:hypothetical protein, conserved [Eimeria brunetti]
MGNTTAVSLDRNEFPVKVKRNITFVDEIVCSDGPVFHGKPALHARLIDQWYMAISRICGKFDLKDLADLVMKAPIPVIVKRFESMRHNARAQDLGRIFRDCFCPGFPDVIKWTPPDLPEKIPAWLMDNWPQASNAASGTGIYEGDTHHQQKSFSRIPLSASAEHACDWPGVLQPFLRRGSTTSSTTAEFTRCEENEFALNIILLWEKLGRKTLPVFVYDLPMTDDAGYYETGSSLVDVPWGFIIPGGRFREMYYWDSYWTIRGLLYSGMVSTARGIILNFTDLIRRFGFIPNGTRSYYLTRSQPPVFSMMLSVYYAFTGDTELIRNTYMDVQNEYLYWLEGEARQVCVTVACVDVSVRKRH